MKRAVLYLRVSTQDQTTANQERELRKVAERAGWRVVHVYRDHGISGTKSKDKRPAFNALHTAAARREFDVVMAWSVFPGTHGFQATGGDTHGAPHYTYEVVATVADGHPCYCRRKHFAFSR